MARESMKLSAHIGHFHTGTGWGGGEYQVLSLIAGLVERQIRTTLFADPSGALFARALEAGLHVESLPRGSPWRVVGEHGIRLLHVHDSAAATLGGRVGRKLGIPVVLSRRVASPIRRNLLSRRKYSARHLSAVIAISQVVADEFRRTGYPGSRIHVVPSGVDIAALDKIARDETFRRSFGGRYLVGGVGTLSVKKNWQLLIQVAAGLADSGLDIQWLLAGEGPEQVRLTRLAQRLGISTRVHFLGFRKDAVFVLKNLDVLFFPSRMEGASVTVREAMVLGVPVVAANAPGTLESLDGHGWAVEMDNVEAAAQAVKEALTNVEKRQMTCRLARASAERRFPLARMIEGSLDVYAQVLS
jgi:glycosyltransferase involved in cell wall biosynthesis